MARERPELGIRFVGNLGWRGLGFLVILLLACRMMTAGLASVPTATPWSTPSPTPSPRPSPTPTLPGDALDYDIVYWDWLIPGLYHLQGQVLPEFIEGTLTNWGSQPMRVRVQAQVEGYTDWAVQTVQLAPGEQAAIHLHPVLRPAAIEQLASLKQANLRLRIDLLSPTTETLEDSTYLITVYARRDFPWTLWKVIDGLDPHTNNMLLAAWVTPNDPKIEEWIRVAADYMPTGHMPSGYRTRTSVYDRLAALWEALDRVYEVTYVSTSVNMGDLEGEEVYFQRIRFPREVLHQQSANCIETTLLWAAAAEALRLHPYIVLTPGHAYVAVDSVPDGSKAYFIETTLIGRGSFDDAIDIGGEEWHTDRVHLENEDEDYDMIDIWEARDQGILPMPWH